MWHSHAAGPTLRLPEASVSADTRREHPCPEHAVLNCLTIDEKKILHLISVPNSCLAPALKHDGNGPLFGDGGNNFLEAVCSKRVQVSELTEAIHRA
jgi:hypothetical protein